MYKVSTGSIMKYSLDSENKKGDSLVNVKSVYSQFNSNTNITMEDEESQIFSEKFSMTLLNGDLIALIGKRGNSDSGNYNKYFAYASIISIKLTTIIKINIINRFIICMGFKVWYFTIQKIIFK